MGITDKAKEIADIALEKAGEYSEKAAEKASELAETAREKAPGYLDRAAELAAKAVDATAAGVDKATGGRFHEQIDSAHGKVSETLARDATTDDTAEAPPFAGGLGTPTPDTDTSDGPKLVPDEDGKG